MNKLFYIILIQLYVFSCYSSETKTKQRNLLSQPELIKKTLADQGLTSLQQAAQSGELSIIQSLLKNGAKIDQKDNNGVPALMYAVLNFHYDVAKYLLEQGANPNITNNKSISPLLNACFSKNIKMVKLLVKYHANFNLGSATKIKTKRH